MKPIPLVFEKMEPGPDTFKQKKQTSNLHHFEDVKAKTP